MDYVTSSSMAPNQVHVHHVTSFNWVLRCLLHGHMIYDHM